MSYKNGIIADLAKSNQYILIIYEHTHKVDYYQEGKTTVSLIRESEVDGLPEKVLLCSHTP